MNLNDFVKVFAAEFNEIPVEEFTSETVYKDLDDWDSLAVLTIISLIDDEFEVTITGADLRSCSTINDLYELILSKVK
jgi:acyl carrier protein